MRITYGWTFECDACGTTATVEPIQAPYSRTPLPVGWGLSDMAIDVLEGGHLHRITDLCAACMSAPSGETLERARDRLAAAWQAKQS